MSNLKNICSPDLESVFCSKKIAPKQNNVKSSTLKNAVIWQVFSLFFNTFCHKSWLHVKNIVKLQRLSMLSRLIKNQYLQRKIKYFKLMSFDKFSLSLLAVFWHKSGVDIKFLSNHSDYQCILTWFRNSAR